MSQSSDGLPTCLICLEPLRPEDFKSGGAITLKCQCQGNTALRHRSCAQEWARVKGDVNCDICHHPITNLPALPPPPPPPPRPENSTSRPLERLRQTEMKGLWFAVHYPRTTLLLTVFFVLLASTLFWAEMVALNGFFVGLIVLVGSPTMVALLLRVSRWDYASRTGTPPYAQYI
ncbi:unnamed protein product [Ostreobium quekettii]|uniref:RING-CH-type domain-containing protein n=1 Tax=Ostreobium quekettii TaxID=121088 RepID=A0A8S1JAK1_9CHLO|nr:unnamed protein product [Ostreobium quekettii]